MRTITMFMLAMSLISLSACSSLSGNVVPEKGPSMEQVYDSMETSTVVPKINNSNIHRVLPMSASNNIFHKIPNPDLKMYVFPHLAEKEEVPIPGYYTTFNAYTRDHYQPQ
jgi:conjugative transfer region lipoprotein (TIGR03751 family)